jgi:hypothetical protein
MNLFYVNYSYKPEVYKHLRKDSIQAEGAVITITELKEL